MNTTEEPLNKEETTPLLPLHLLRRSNPAGVHHIANRYQCWWGDAGNTLRLTYIMEDTNPTDEQVEVNWRVIETYDDPDLVLSMVYELLDTATGKRMFLDQLKADGGMGKSGRQILTDALYEELSAFLVSQQEGILARGNKALERFNVRLGWDEYSCLVLVEVPAKEAEQ